MYGTRPKARAYVSGKSRRPDLRLRRLGWGGLAVAAGLSFGLLLWHAGWPQRQAQKLAELTLDATGAIGFRLQEVTITGRHYTDKDQLLDSLQVARGMPILAIDRAAMAGRLQAMPWLASAVIERQLPDTLFIDLTERQPLARWQYQEKLQVIDHDGRVISAAAPKRFANLPLVVGNGADERAYHLLETLTQYPEIQKILRAAVCVGTRRWDLQLEPGVTVRLPEGKEAEGLKRLTALMTDPQILSRAVQTIDLRLSDRLTVERVPGSAPPPKPGAGAQKI